MKKPYRAIMASFTLVLLIFLVTCKTAPPERNVLLISIDTLRADRLSCYNKRFVQTPNIDSIAAANKALELDPNLAHSYILLGMAGEKLGRKAEAITNYRRALELDPDNEYALRELGKILSYDPATYKEGRKLKEKARNLKRKN